LISRPKGTNDIYGEEIEYWQYFEKAARKVAGVFGFQEIRTPIFEMAELFIRSVGDETDIVQKEMYTFEDKGHRLLCLRPEGTAAVVRSFIENNMVSEGLPRQVYYIGPMFRYERPQTGRQRQFHQFGAELIGSSSPLADAEMLWMSVFLLEELRLHRYTLHINMLGCQKDRESYKAALKDYYKDKLGAVCPDCRRRYETNVLRLLDCKVDACQPIKEKAPELTEFLCPECRDHKGQVSQILIENNIDAIWNTRLVRGLDYYTGIVFEVKYPFKETVFDLLGGGRYDHVIEQLGGNATPSVGFACGIERMVATMREEKAIAEPAALCQVFVLSIGEEAKKESLKITDFLRKRGISVQHDLMGRNIRNQLKYADKQRALYTIIIGEDELDKGVYLVKEMETGDQIEVESSWVENYILEKLTAL